MAIDPSILAAIRIAVEADPQNLALRVHFGNLLLENGEGQLALDQAKYILGSQPDFIDGLKLGVAASKLAGDTILGHGYQRLLTALQMNSAQAMIETSILDPGESESPTPPSLTRPPARQSLSASDFSPSRDEPEDLSDEHESEPTYEIETPDLTLRDVKGLKSVKERIEMAFLGPLRNPELRKLYGKSLRGGLLLYGPPGCGKTFVAKAVAGELGAKFLSIGLTDVVDMWLGESEKNLHSVFEIARRKRPVVIFIDEIDALGRKRSLMRDHAGRSIINQLLTELDGIATDNEGIFVIAATNHPWDVDSALRRPGRLDRTVLVLPPDQTAREEIFVRALEDRPTDSINHSALAKQTDDFSGADIVHLVDSAVEIALADSIRSGVVRPIRNSDFKIPLKQVKPSTRAWFETAKNHALYSNEGGSYDDLITYLQAKKML